MDGERIPFALPNGLSNQGRISDADFVDDSHAWLRYSGGGQDLLIVTTDQGKTSKIIWSGEIIRGVPQ
jgi:hypothetical protein